MIFALMLLLGSNVAAATSSIAIGATVLRGTNPVTHGSPQTLNAVSGHSLLLSTQSTSTNKVPTRTGLLSVSSIVEVRTLPHAITPPVGFSSFPPKVANETSYLQAKSQQQASAAAVVTAQPSTVLGSGAQPLSILSGFDGINGTQCNCAPPDVQVAAGPSYVMEMVNLAGEIWTKSGLSVENFSLSSFYGPGTLSDPKVFYDNMSARWFSSILNESGDSIDIAVSQTSNPLGSYYVYEGITTSPNSPDEPILGVSNDTVAVSANIFTTHGATSSLAGSEYWIINKAEMLSGSTASLQSFGPDSSQISINPVQSLSSSSTLYMVSVGGISKNAYIEPTTTVTLYSVVGVPPAAVTTTTQSLTVTSIAFAPSAPQPGTTDTIDTGDYRTQDAIWNQGNLYLVLNDGCQPDGDTTIRSCVRLIEINTAGSTPTVTHDFDIADSGYYFFYPALGIDSAQNLDIVFGFSSSTVYPGIAVTAQSAGSPETVSSSSPILKSGSADSNPSFACSSHVCRYGDYFGAGVDPSNPSIVWVAGEYMKNPTSNLWYTFVGSMTDCLCISLSPSSGPPGTVVTVTGTGFAASSSVHLKYNGSPVTTTPSSVSTNGVGTFTASFAVPSSSPTGSNTVSATDGSGNTASASFDDTPNTVAVPDLSFGSSGIIVAIIIALASYGFIRYGSEARRSDRRKNSC